MMMLRACRGGLWGFVTLRGSGLYCSLVVNLDAVLFHSRRNSNRQSRASHLIYLECSFENQTFIRKGRIAGFRAAVAKLKHGLYLPPPITVLPRNSKRCAIRVAKGGAVVKQFITSPSLKKNETRLNRGRVTRQTIREVVWRLSWGCPSAFRQLPSE